MFAELGACAGDRLPISPRIWMRQLSLIERTRHDLFGDAGDLDVHLQRGDAQLVPATLKSMSPR